MIQAYAANTNQGVFRNYNEDRVSIILNITKPTFKEIDDWPTCSFFAVYDGHGGASCADFLRDNLHQFIVKQDAFPSDPVTAIREGFDEAEKFFLEIVENAADEAMQEANETNYEGFVDNSGSCAIVILIIDQKVYVANVGDSRALMSAQGGKKSLGLSKDHKPDEEGEVTRILANGGKIYQTQTMVPKLDGSGNECILGPHRVFPGRLSVSRSFGDIEAKLAKYNGGNEVIVADPEIRVFDVTDDMDYIMLACDGIFDKMTNKEVTQIVWEGVMENKTKNVHKHCGIAVDRVLRTSVAKKTMDNITVVFVAFKNFEECIKGSPMMIDNNLNPVGSSKMLNSTFVVDDELIVEEDFPEKCVSDWNYIQGRCKTPRYLQPKPKGYKFNCPTIITANPEELANYDSYEQLEQLNLQNAHLRDQPDEGSNSYYDQHSAQFEPLEENFTDEALNEESQNHPYHNISKPASEAPRPNLTEHEPVRSKQYEGKKDTVAKKPYSVKRDHSDKRQNNQQNNHFDLSVS